VPNSKSRHSAKLLYIQIALFDDLLYRMIRANVRQAHEDLTVSLDDNVPQFCGLASGLQNNLCLPYDIAFISNPLNQLPRDDACNFRISTANRLKLAVTSGMSAISRASASSARSLAAPPGCSRVYDSNASLQDLN